MLSVVTLAIIIMQGLAINVCMLDQELQTTLQRVNLFVTNFTLDNLLNDTADISEIYKTLSSIGSYQIEIESTYKIEAADHE